MYIDLIAWDAEDDLDGNYQHIVGAGEVTAEKWRRCSPTTMVTIPTRTPTPAAIRSSSAGRLGASGSPSCTATNRMQTLSSSGPSRHTLSQNMGASTDESEPAFPAHTRQQLDALSPEKRARAEAALTRIQSPEYQESERKDREALDREYGATGTIASTPVTDADIEAFEGFIRSLRHARVRRLEPR